jgi:hypothetical protein
MTMPSTKAFERRAKNRLPTLAASLLWALCSVGCANSVKDIARESTKAVVDESVDQLTAEDSKQQIAEAANDPRMEQAINNITDQVTEGVLRAMASGQTQENLAKLTAIATRAATKQMLDTLGSEEMRARLSDMTGAMTKQILANVGTAMRDDLMPTLKGSLARDFSEVAATSLNNGQLHEALGTTVQHVAYNAVLGAGDGLTTSWRGDTGESVRGAAKAGMPLVQMAFWGLLALALCLICAAVIAIARNSRARTEVRRLETATLLLATAMRERNAGQETDEIVTVVRDALEKSAAEHHRGGLLGILRMRHH